MVGLIEDEEFAILKEAEEVIRGRQPDSIGLSGKLSSFDMRVYNAICHLYSIGNRIITWQQLRNALGYYDVASEEVISALKESVRDIGSVSVTKSYRDVPGDGDTYVRDDLLLNAAILKTIAAGVEIDLFELLCEPPIDSLTLNESMLAADGSNPF